jgi:hypothetical protein
MSQVKLTGAKKRLQDCPDWSVCEKPGHLKKNTNHKTVMDHIEAASSGKKHKCQQKMFCKICQKWNHTTVQCYKNPVNRSSLDNSLKRVNDKVPINNEEAVAIGKDEDGRKDAL